jgi:hypothetical protein
VKFSERKLRSQKVLQRALTMIVDADERHGMTMPDVVDAIFPGLDEETCLRAADVLIEILQGGGYIKAAIGEERPTRRRMN